MLNLFLSTSLSRVWVAWLGILFEVDERRSHIAAKQNIVTECELFVVVHVWLEGVVCSCGCWKMSLAKHKSSGNSVKGLVNGVRDDEETKSKME